MSRKGEVQRKHVFVKIRRRLSTPLGWTGATKSKSEPKSGDGLKCCLCNKIAHNKVKKLGYCPDHYKEACEAQAKISNPNTYFLNYEYAGSPRGAYLALRSIE
jgi:hypothetical protein